MMNSIFHPTIEDKTNAVLRSLHTGIPKLVLFSDTPYELVLRAAKVGDIIEDPECDADFEVLGNGIFQRCKVERDGEVIGLRWMFLCGSDDLADFIKYHTVGIADQEIAWFGVAAVWQSGCWEKSQRRKAARK